MHQYELYYEGDCRVQKEGDEPGRIPFQLILSVKAEDMETATLVGRQNLCFIVLPAVGEDTLLTDIKKRM